MACQVVGKKTGTFVDRKNGTGKLIEFGRLYVTYPDQTVDGQACEAVSIKPMMLKEIKVGDSVRFDRNQYGKVISVEKV